MDVVWGRHLSAFAVGDVLAILKTQRDIAYTTVMTTVARLYEKGILEREGDGRRYLYTPRLTREEFLQATAREVLDEAVGGRQAMAMLAEKVSEASAGELDDLEALIQKRREELDT
jgi:predicted transcriptional regulator